MQENLLVGLEPGRHDVAIETTHTLERLATTGSRDSGNVARQESVTNNKEKNSRARTPEEGICLEFEEFNPELTETQQRQEKLNKRTDKKEFNHNHQREKKEINFFNDVSVFQNHGNTSNKVPAPHTEENQTIIYSKPDKKRKGDKLEVKNPIEKNIATHKSENNVKNENLRNVSKSSTVDSKPISESITNASEKIVTSNLKLAEKIGIFENKKTEKPLHEKKRQDPGKNDKPTKKLEDLEQEFIVISKTKVNEAKASAKTGRERDRGVEVYMETVRQRSAVRDKKQLTTELFERQQRLPGPVACPDTAMDTDTSVGLPSVRKLLARFENTEDIGDNSEAPVTRAASAGSKSRLVKSHSIHGVDLRANKTHSRKLSSQTLYESEKAIVVPSPSFRAIEKKVSQQSHPTVRSFDLDDEVAEEKLEQSKQWDPQYFVKCLYNIAGGCAASEDAEAGVISLVSASHSCPSIEGYMERLPAGRKKSTMWNSWKRQYFIAKNGVLNIFEDKTQGEFLGKFELFGGNIDFMDSNMLGIQDR